jgi:hypothetical protein
MPIYCYETEDGQVVEELFPVGKAPKTVVLDDGSVAKRNLACELKPCRSHTGAGWPFECIASGVHPSQAQQLRDYFRKAGVPTDVSPGGNPVYTSAAHRKRALKCRGFFDKSSFS